MNIEYHSDSGVDNLFECVYGLGTISATFCAERHKKASTLEYITEHRCKTCRFCPVGAKHAGKRDTVSGSILYGSLFCSRCECNTQRILGRCECISCYNRRLENKKGLNAKGNPIKFKRDYFKQPVLLISKNEIKLRVVDNVGSLSEAVFRVLLTDNNNYSFGWSGAGVLQNAR